MMRTNRVGSSMTFEVSGTMTLGIEFGTTYLSLEGGTEIPPVIGWRMSEATDANDGSWTTAAARGVLTISDLLDPATAYNVELKVMRLGTVADDRVERSNVETWWEIEEGIASQDTDPIGGYGPAGRFLEVTSILVDTGGSVDASAPIVTDQAEVLVVGGLTVAGQIKTADGAVTDLGAVKTPVVLALERAAADLSTAHRVVLLTSAGREIRYSSVSFPRGNLDGSSYLTSDDYLQGQAVLNGVRVVAPEHQNEPDNALAVYDVLTVTRGDATTTPQLLLVDLGTDDMAAFDTAVTATAWALALGASIAALITNFRAAYSDAPALIIVPHQAPAAVAQFISSDYMIDLLEIAADSAVSTLALSSSDVDVVRLRDAVRSATDSLAPWGPVITEDQADYLARVDGELYVAIDALIASVF